jgi:hypothetical protein
MNIVFGHLVGDFNGYFVPDSTVTESKFKSSVSTNAYADSHDLSNQLANKTQQAVSRVFVCCEVLLDIHLISGFFGSLSPG